MNILGLYDGHNTSAALISDGKILKAVEEERFSRVKNHDGRVDGLCAPYDSVKYCISNIGANNIDAIALALEKPEILQKNAINSYIDSVRRGFSERIKCDEIKGLSVDGYDIFLYPLKTQLDRINKIKLWLKEAGVQVDQIPFYYVNHHLSHVASAYYTSPYNDALIITLDGKGDDLCGMVAIGRSGKIEVIEKVNYIHSIGHIYSAITVACGFKAVRHEGKITGLAAYAQPDPELMTAFRELVQVRDGKWYSKLNMKNKLGPYPHTVFDENITLIRELVNDLSRETMSATVQKITEELVCEFIEYYVNKYKDKTVLLAGGVFANVKINQRVHEIDGIENIYIHPAMNDAGLSVGAALGAYYQDHNYNGCSFDNVFFGPSYGESEIEALLIKENIEYTKPDDISVEVAKHLFEGKVIARFDGGLEYGSRSLGNRSILYQTTDNTVNDWLNKKLDRTEFMPFAPITLFEKRNSCYLNVEGTEHTAQFMTITYNCTELMKNQSPAVVHIDGTARPQFVSESNNPGLYSILTTYYEMTGIPSLINTSFNVHEEPIVCTPSDAIKSFRTIQLDYLQIGSFIVKGYN